jgi:hypothetical protein
MEWTCLQLHNEASTTKQLDPCVRWKSENAVGNHRDSAKQPEMLIAENCQSYALITARLIWSTSKYETSLEILNDYKIVWLRDSRTSTIVADSCRKLLSIRKEHYRLRFLQSTHDSYRYVDIIKYFLGNMES